MDPLREAPETHRRILVVDDDEASLRQAEQVLGSGGWQVETAISPEQALQRMGAASFQVIVSDDRMPGMSGVELLRRVRERFPDAQRVLLAGPQGVEEAIERGEGLRFISKPWDAHQLAVTVGCAFDEWELREENRRLLQLTLKQNEQLNALRRELEAKVDERTALLSRGKKEIELTFDAIDRPIVMVGRDLKVARANRAWAALAGVPITEVVGKDCFALFRRDRPCGGCPLALGTRSAGHVELSIGERSIQLSAYSAADIDVCIYRDMTEEKLLTRRMLQTEKMAAVGQLAAGVAHEINNPLGGILAFTQLMQRDAGRSCEDKETLGDIEQAALRCKRTVAELIKFSRRTPSNVKAPFDLNRAAEDAVTLFRTHLKSKPRAKLEVALSPEPVPVCGDSSQIAQVVLSFLFNSLQALEAGEGAIQLATRRDGALALLSVRDDGTGILPEHLPHIFEPTFTTKPPGEGTGFGLAIGWSVAEAHGGGIEVESQPGAGATFTLRLPAAAEPASNDGEHHG